MVHLLGILLCRITAVVYTQTHFCCVVNTAQRAAYTYLAIKEQQSIIYCHKATVCTQRGSFLDYKMETKHNFLGFGTFLRWGMGQQKCIKIFGKGIM